MPESVTDRLTKSHEVIYHFVKQGKYYYDLDAIREPHTGGAKKVKWHDTYKRSSNTKISGHQEGRKNEVEQSGDCIMSYNPKGKNPGDVWQINTQPYKEAHFAVFPLKLVENPILAGCPVGGRVLDMFGGSGTVAEFCRHNDRECTIIELNEEYTPLIKSRSMADTPLLSSYANAT